MQFSRTGLLALNFRYFRTSADQVYAYRRFGAFSVMRGFGILYRSSIALNRAHVKLRRWLRRFNHL